MRIFYKPPDAVAADFIPFFWEGSCHLGYLKDYRDRDKHGEGTPWFHPNRVAIRFWFGPRLSEYIGREAELPFDQHFLKAAIAPRLLLTTEALGDLWANPAGTWQTHAAAREVYRFLGVEERIGIWYRAGGHAHGRADLETLLDFMDWHFRGRQPVFRYDRDPFATA
jgi:hypothetical protein